MAVQTRYWNIIFFCLLAFLSIGIYFAYTFVYDVVDSVNSSRTVRGMYQSILFYTFVIFFTGLEMIIDFTRVGLQKYYRPTSVDILREQLKREKHSELIKVKDIQMTRSSPSTKIRPTNLELVGLTNNPQHERH